MVKRKVNHISQCPSYVNILYRHIRQHYFFYPNPDTKLYVHLLIVRHSQYPAMIFTHLFITSMLKYQSNHKHFSLQSHWFVSYCLECRILFYFCVQWGMEITAKPQKLATGHLPHPHLTLYSTWISFCIFIISGPLNLIIFILPLTRPKVISTSRYHESCWVFPMKEQSMIEVTKGALFNAVDKNQPHFTIYLMSLV